MPKNLLFGLGAGILFAFLLTTSQGLSIGIPTVPLNAADNARFAIIGGVAPVIEEIFLGAVVIELLALFFAGGSRVSTFTYILLSAGAALIFSLFHLAAYTQGAYVAGSTPFIGAFVFRFAAQIMMRNIGLVSTIVLHSIINISLLASLVIA